MPAPSVAIYRKVVVAKIIHMAIESEADGAVFRTFSDENVATAS